MSKLTNIQIPKLDTSSLIPEIRVEGKWKEATILIDNIEPIILKSYNKAVKSFSKEIIGIVKHCIINGIPPKGVHWAKHSPLTIKRYGGHHLLNLSGKYARVIGIYQYSKRTYIGVPLNLKLGGKKKLTMGALARILEYGSNDGKIPGRPLWAPTLKMVGGKKKIAELIKTNIRKEIISITGLNANQIRW